MARQVFFSFHHGNDLWRANVVRKSHVVKRKEQEIGRYDRSLWEAAKTKGNRAIQKLIDDGLSGASVTIVLIGAETYMRKWCLYEIAKSHNDGKGLLGITLHNVRDQRENTGTRGRNPFAYVETSGVLGLKGNLASKYPIYDWVRDDGYSKVDTWIEAAAKAVGR